MKKKFYFGHPVSDYGSELESRLIRIIQETLLVEVENPNQKIHFEGYNRYKENEGKGMNYYFKELLPLLDGGVFLAFPNQSFGAGVWGEAEFFARAQKPVYEITRGGIITRLVFDESRRLSIEETIKMLHELKSQIKE